MSVLIRGGRIVTAADDYVADLYVEDETITMIGESLDLTADKVIDAAGKYVLPGGVDPHVHLTAPSNHPGERNWVDDFESGSTAALAGGVTTVGNITFPYPGTTMAEALERDEAVAGATSVADYFFHPVLRDPNEENLAQIGDLIGAGHSSIKLFLSFRRFDRNVDHYLDAMRRCGAAGGIALLHCEDAAVMDGCAAELRAAGRTHPRHYPESRSVQSEAVATARAVAFAETAACPTYVVHLAAESALDACRRGRRRGIPVYVETRPLYLHLTAERFDEPDGAKYAGAPPLRAAQDRAALWAGLRFGDVDVVATDHAPWRLADKLDPALDAISLRQGVADLETSLPMLWSEGVRRGHLTPERFVAVTATNPARLFGLHRKGTIAVGGDADVVVFDPDETRIVDGATMHSNADYSPYDGWEVTGWPAVTIRRGEIVAVGTEVRATGGSGRPAARGQHRPI
jgi:dihydropyrimidinase